jgi:hypothetical protein
MAALALPKNRRQWTVKGCGFAAVASDPAALPARWTTSIQRAPKN